MREGRYRICVHVYVCVLYVFVTVRAGSACASEGQGRLNKV